MLAPNPSTARIQAGTPQTELLATARENLPSHLLGTRDHAVVHLDGLELAAGARDLHALEPADLRQLTGDLAGRASSLKQKHIITAGAGVVQCSGGMLSMEERTAPGIARRDDKLSGHYPTGARQVGPEARRQDALGGCRCGLR